MSEGNTLGKRIKQFRTKQNLSLSELARRADVSKACMSQIESGKTKQPSAFILTKIAMVLDVELSELVRSPDTFPYTELFEKKFDIPIPPSLQAFAVQEELDNVDIEMLAQISYRGKQPTTVSDWKFLFEAIKRSVR